MRALRSSHEADGGEAVEVALDVEGAQHCRERQEESHAKK